MKNLDPHRTAATRAFGRELHKFRNGLPSELDLVRDADLVRAWHALQLHWLASVPGYREEIRARVSEAAKQAEMRTRKIETAQAKVLGLSPEDWYARKEERGEC